MYDWSVGLVVSGGHLKPEKVFWYPIWWGWTCGRTSIIPSYHLEKIYLTKKDVEQVSNEILNAQQYSQLIESWGKKLFYITK